MSTPITPTSAASAPSQNTEKANDPHSVGFKETFTSLIIAFALAFVFRGFVVEPYVIPTNSMAPTLLGAHVRVTDPDTGYSWPVTTWYQQQAGGSSVPLPQQGGTYRGMEMGPMRLYDPMTRQPIENAKGLPTLAGDRIFVLRYTEPVFSPTRYDVVVFKTPTSPDVNFIKRLIGLPNEEIALIDGDVFVRPRSASVKEDGVNTWLLDGWTVAAKPPIVQRAVWQAVFDSRYAPAKTKDGKPFQGPFLGGAGWDIAGKSSYEYTGSGPSKLRWDTEPLEKLDLLVAENAGSMDGDKIRRAARSQWMLIDRFPMDENFPEIMKSTNSQQLTSPNSGQVAYFPVSDLRMSASIEPKTQGESFTAVINTRGHEFRGRLSPKGDGYEATVEMRTQGENSEWKILDARPISGVMQAGKVTNFEFWHYDQQVQVWIEGKIAAAHQYAWTPANRVKNTLGKTIEEIWEADAVTTKPSPPRSMYGNPSLYCKPAPWFEVSGPVKLHRIAIDRDLFYQPVMVGVQPGGLFEKAAGGGCPSPKTRKLLGPDQYFVCGDNSPMSSDARDWNTVDPWVAALVDPTPGIVPSKLMIGKAFMVYFPAVQQREMLGTKVPMIDAGRVRWIN